MKEEALYFYDNGYNCSQCILKAAEQFYKIPISKQYLNMCAAVNNGFGIGGMCSVLISAIMVFGLIFDESTAKRLRIKLLSEFSEKYSNFNCSMLVKFKDDSNSCHDVISYICDIMEKIIDEERHEKRNYG